MQFIAQCENAILLKNMNDSNCICFNHLNILFNPDIINPFLESHLKYMQIIEDSIDKKILGKLKVQNKEFSQKQLESLINNLIEINNDNSINNNNNFNLGNLSSIHKKKISREESPTSQRDDDFDLTSFSTTIGGKASHNISNTKFFSNNKTNNSKQVRTFKIRTKDGFSEGDIENNNYNPENNNKSYNNSRNNSNNNSYRNNLLRKDSPNSIHSNNSSDNNPNSNYLSPINKNKNNFQSKNSSNTSLKDQNISNKNYINNNISNKIINKKNHKSYLSDINSFQTVNAIKINKDINIKNISKKIIKKKLIAPEQILGPKDTVKSPRKTVTNITNMDNREIKNYSKKQENIINFNDNNYQYINNTISDITPKKPKIILNKMNFLNEKNKRSKSPDLILNNKGETESENSRIIFNNIRPKAMHNYSNSNSNNDSSLMNNLINLSSLTSRRVNNTNILDNDKFIQNYFEQNEPSYLKTEVNKDNNSYIKGVIKKKKIVQNKNTNPFKNESNDIKKNKIEVKCIKGVKKINDNINKTINKTNNKPINILNNKVLKKEIKINNNNEKIKVINDNSKINENKKVVKKLNFNFNTEKFSNKKEIEKNSKNNLNRNKVDTKLILNQKKIETNKNINNNNVKKNLNQNNIKTNNSFKKNKEKAKKNTTLFDDNLENINFLDDEEPEPQNSTIKKEEFNINNNNKGEKENTDTKILTKNNDNKINLNNKDNANNYNDKNKFNNQIINNKIQNNIEKNQNKNRKRNIKKLKDFKNIIFNIDLSNDNEKDFPKSEDVSDNSISNEEKIYINSLNEKIKPSLKEKVNIINKKHINNKKNELNKIGNNLSNYQREKNSNEKKFSKINKKPKIAKIGKETNMPNNKIKKLIIEKNDNNSENIDDLDDVCNFSGINNKSYTNKTEIEQKNELFNENFDDDDFQRAHSPKPIFHKKIKFDSKYKNINKTQINKNLNIKNKQQPLNSRIHTENVINDKDLMGDILTDDDHGKIIYNKEIKNDIYENNLNNLKENNEKNIADKNCKISTKASNNIYTSSQGYFSFKIKKGNNKEKLPLIEEKNENDKNKYIKNNESISESIASSKFNFKINDEIHESEFNDVEFLD